MQSILGLAGLIAFTTIYFLLPETSQPGERGIDKVKANGTQSSGSFVFINPLQSLWLLRSPSMLLIVGLFYAILAMLLTCNNEQSIIVFASMVSAFGEGSFIK